MWRITERASITPPLARLFRPRILEQSAYNSSTDGFPEPVVVPRTTQGVMQSEAWLQPAMNWLLKQVDARWVLYRSACEVFLAYLPMIVPCFSQVAWPRMAGWHRGVLGPDPLWVLQA